MEPPDSPAASARRIVSAASSGSSPKPFSRSALTGTSTAAAIAPALATAASRSIDPSRPPRVAAAPLLVVHRAKNPSDSSSLAEPTSHGFGARSGSPGRWRASEVGGRAAGRASMRRDERQQARLGRSGWRRAASHHVSVVAPSRNASGLSSSVSTRVSSQRRFRWRTRPCGPVVRVRVASVEHVVVVHELHVARAQLHRQVERGIGAHGVDAVHRLARRGRGRRRVGVAAGRQDVGPDVPHEEPVGALCVNTGIEVPGPGAGRLLARGCRRRRARRARRPGRARCARARCGSSPRWRPGWRRRWRPASRQKRPTRSEPSEWKGNATPPISLPRLVGS